MCCSSGRTCPCGTGHIADILGCAEDHPISCQQIIRNHVKGRHGLRRNLASVIFACALQCRIGKRSGVNRGCMGDDQQMFCHGGNLPLRSEWNGRHGELDYDTET